MIFCDKNNIKEIGDALLEGKIIAFPTETVFGLGVLSTKEEYFTRLCRVKKRRPDKPFTLMVSDINLVKDYLYLNDYSKKLIKEFSPGPITYLLKKKENVPHYLSLDSNYIGVRIPNDDFLLSLLKYINKPLLVPSCNPSDLTPASNVEEVIKYFNDDIDGIVKGESSSNIPSTIIKIDDFNFKIIRQGEIKEEELRKIKMKIVIGSDHGGFEIKERLIEDLKKENIDVIDVGCYSKESCNYAEFGLLAAKKVKEKEVDYGILICNSGEGISIAANKVKGVRCGLLYNDDVAHLVKEHNNCNMIAFGASFMKYEDILRRVHIFLNANFEGGRHEKRVETILNYEK